MKHFTLLCLTFLFTILTAFAQTPDMEKISQGLQPRSIGPAGMSGRVTAIDAVHSNPDMIYAGSASGGLWKSEGGGVSWKPVFDEQPVAAIGSIAIYQKNPDIIYVGTGEGNPRNSQSAGNGMYKTLDGGKTWQHLGLEKTRNIHRVIVHPDNPDIVYAGAIGAAWEDTPDRGVYKSTDGGQTWKKILFVNERTGVADMIMDPGNPDKLIVALWEYRRWPWFFKSGGEGSGLHITLDGGKTWQQRTPEDGLPKGTLGRIGLGIVHSHPNIIYALVESKKNALYRSDDGGATWKMTADKNIGDRPFYYADVAVDPENENRVYNVFSNVTVSNDGGKTFETLLGWDNIHGDHHFWWIHPQDPSLIMNGNDGGMAISRDRGQSWRFIENLPFAQLYHINVDRDVPYHVMGGMQDNGSWRGPAYVWQEGGIRNAYWEEVGFGDGFDVVPDSSDARYLYAMWQGGNLLHVDTQTGASTFIQPSHPDGEFLRFNWNAGMAHDPFDKTTIYLGSQYVHKSTDRGQTWQIISPDLTTNDSTKQKQLESGGLTYDVTQAENYTTITVITPSLQEKGVLWVGTDDGNVQLTRDGGKTWTNTVGKIKDLPQGSWVQQIHASAYQPGEAFVVFDNHRKNDWTPYVYRTADYGKTWNRLIDSQDVFGFALSFVQDPVEPRLMFLGTESGLYLSLDEGANWQKWGKSYPTVPTMDMVIHPRDYDLVIGTFGRAAFVLDDIRPLRALAKQGRQLLEEPLHVYEAPDAWLAATKEAAGTRFTGNTIYKGENRPYGALVTFSIRDILKKEADSVKAEKDSVQVEVLNEDGEVVRSFKAEAQAGMNRFAWDLSRNGVRNPGTPKPEKKDAPKPKGATVLPGTYTIRVSYGDYQKSTKVKVKLDPRLDIAEQNLIARNNMIEKYMETTSLATRAVDQLNEAAATIDLIMKQLAEREGEPIKKIKDMGKALKDSIRTYKELIAQKEDVQGIVENPHIVSGKLGEVSAYLYSMTNTPNKNMENVMQEAEQSLKQPLAKVNQFFKEDWMNFRKAVENANVSFFEEYESLGMNK